MNKLLMTFLALCLATIAYADQAYMDKFTAYTQWRQNLPKGPDPDFVAFIKSDTPLSNKLREKWLYQLAKNKDWLNFKLNYRPSDDTALQCYDLLAKYYQGQKQEALNAAKPLWLVGHSQPKACDALFSLLLHSETFDERLIGKRIDLALEQRNMELARALLKQYKKPRIADTQTLFSIYLHPERIIQLTTAELHDAFYLYGLKRMVSTNMNKAIQYWQHVKTRKLLSESQQQDFLAHLALYKAMRGHEDAYEWFKKVKPDHYNDVLMDWQSRFALKRHKWRRLERLISASKDKENPCWQYWLGRSFEARGKKNEAQALYQSLSKKRHYYGFLASLKLNKPLHFENEVPMSSMEPLKLYRPVLEKIQKLYSSKNDLDASRLVNDFSLELSKEEASAFAYWLAYDLHWYGKSVYLSNTNEGLNHQLALRFPLSYQEIITNFSRNYALQPEFVYAIIRQESAFRGDVMSSAGALGLMQLMPNTAKKVASLEKIPYQNQQQLFDTQKNIHIGSAYLKELAKRFDKHPVLMAAAYNAGPKQVNYWLKNDQDNAMDIWIETLPWHETRNYLKNVIAFCAVYQYRMKKKIDLKPFLNRGSLAFHSINDGLFSQSRLSSKPRDSEGKKDGLEASRPRP